MEIKEKWNKWFYTLPNKFIPTFIYIFIFFLPKVVGSEC